MLLYDCKFNDKLHLELVDGEDIIKTYRNNWRVHSCLSRSSKLAFFTRVPGCKILRLVRSNLFTSIVHARALVWLATTEDGKKVTLLDTVYSSGYYDTDRYTLYKTFKDYFDYVIHFRDHIKAHIDVPECYLDSKGIKINSIPWLDNFTHIIKSEEERPKFSLYRPSDTKDFYYIGREYEGFYGRWRGQIWKRHKIANPPKIEYTSYSPYTATGASCTYTKVYYS